ncbi:superoxide dismutase [Cu-Zn] isoform X2 [Halictus rubicundus]|uniref:superoxide dismutase [Cu-Zn] isoform X2 n=1 Tax=Halictus rubicundus TaxID=77578 RepID=UPI004036598B
MNVVLRRLSTRDFRMNRLLILLLAITAIAAKKTEMLCGIVHLQPHNIEQANVTGDLTVIQRRAGDPVKIEGKIYGLTKGLHGFHVHEKGDLRQGCTSAGAHFNPTRMDHGAPDDDERHVGDLGNIEANDEGVATIDITDSIISLTGPHSILGRSIVVHAYEDNLGLGHDEESQTTGKSGPRVACGIIGVLKI